MFVNRIAVEKFLFQIFEVVHKITIFCKKSICFKRTNIDDFVINDLSTFELVLIFESFGLNVKSKTCFFKIDLL